MQIILIHLSGVADTLETIAQKELDHDGYK